LRKKRAYCLLPRTKLESKGASRKWKINFGFQVDMADFLPDKRFLLISRNTDLNLS
jgi:hypothetical protein